MKITPSFLLIAALSPTTLLFSACFQKDSAESVVQETKEVAAEAKQIAADSWEQIKGYTFEQRDEFAASMDRMGTALEAKLEKVPAATAPAREATVTEFKAARAALKVQLAAARTSTSETWAHTKAETAAAWQRVQTAFNQIAP